MAALALFVCLLAQLAYAQTITTYVPQTVTSCSNGGVCASFPAATDATDTWCNFPGATITTSCGKGNTCSKTNCARFEFNSFTTAPYTAHWLVGTNMKAQSVAPRFGNDTITGAQVAFSVNLQNNQNNGINIETVTLVNPKTGQLVVTTTTEPGAAQANFRLTTQGSSPVCIPSNVANNFQCSTAGYMWNGPGFSISTVNLTDPSFGIAVQFSLNNNKDSQPQVYLSNLRLILFWQSGLGPTSGTTLPPTNSTAGQSTVPADSFSMLGAIIGGTIGGVILIAAGIIVLVYFVRRRQLQKPAIKLDNPIPYSPLQ